MFEVKNGDLHIKLTVDELKELKGHDRKRLRSLPSDQAFAELIEYEICNGWQFIEPEEVGALTSCIMLSSDCDRDDYGTLTELNNLFTNIAWYQIQCPVEQLLRGETIVFHGEDCTEDKAD